jgi:outer membrane protein assembly factor BamB
MKIIILLFLSIISLTAQTLGVIDTVSSSGQQSTASFSWNHTLGTASNMGILVDVGIKSGLVKSVTFGSISLVQVTACADPQYGNPATSSWTLPLGSVPVAGSNVITVNLNKIPTSASAVAYSVSGVDTTQPIDVFACHALPYGTGSTADSISFTTKFPDDFVIASMYIPNTSNAATMLNYPGNEDILTASGGGDVAFFSHTQDSGNVGPQTYSWKWSAWEPNAGTVVAFKILNSAPPPPPPPPPPPGTSPVNFIQWPTPQPTSCPNTGLTFYIDQTFNIFFCTPNATKWYSASAGKVWDSWQVAFHDSQHTGRTTDVVLPPLKALWIWKDNNLFDLAHGYNGFYPNSLIAYQNEVCFQGGLNANRVICLNGQDRSFLLEVDNSGYTQSGSAYQFINYPVIINGKLIFTSVDFTTTANLVDGTGYSSVYNTNGGWPSGGETTLNGKVYQTFVETDDGSENFIIYSNLDNLSLNQVNYHSFVSGFSDSSFRVPSVDPLKSVAYTVISGQLRAFDATVGNILWSYAPQTFGASPAINKGNVICYITSKSTLDAITSSGVTIWSTPLAKALSPIVYNGIVYVGASDNYFYALNADTGAILWKFKTQQAFTSTQIPAISGSLIYVPASDGNIYILDIQTGNLISSYNAPGVIWGPVIISQGLVFASIQGNGVYAFQPFTSRKGI